MACALGLASSWVFGGFSAALVLSALIAPWVGRAIDARGGRVVLTASNLVLALAPFLFGLCLEYGGVSAALWLTSSCCVVAFIALILLRAAPSSGAGATTRPG